MFMNFGSYEFRTLLGIVCVSVASIGAVMGLKTKIVSTDASARAAADKIMVACCAAMVVAGFQAFPSVMGLIGSAAAIMSAARQLT
jgi:hypothetical protein